MEAGHEVDMQLDVPVPMQDGVKLSADIYRPRGAGPFSTVLIRTPYSNNVDGIAAQARRFAQRGYACVAQDVRGRWDSEGDFYPFREGRDGYDTQQWIGAQPWSNGRIGMSGGSYVAAVQWQSAPYGSPHLRCIVPRVMCTEYYNGLMYPGGAFQLGVGATWSMRTCARTAQSIDHHRWSELFRALPVADLPRQGGRELEFWRDCTDHPACDGYWEEFNGHKHWQDIKAPALIMGGWYDLYAAQAFSNYNGMRLHGGSPEARQSRLIVGPWPHALSTSTQTGDVDFGPRSLADLDGLESRWFEHWLDGKDTGILHEPPLRLFIMGVNQWRNEHEWPLGRTQWQNWYLHSGGHANTVIGDGMLSPEVPTEKPPDRFVYDPQYPVPTCGGNNCCSPELVPWGPQDQRGVEMRSDVLCYTSAPLDTDLEVTGPVKVVLFACTDGPDTDWTAKLVDVSPSGYAMNLCDGILRARYREGFSTPHLLEPGQVYEYTIEVGVTGNVFRRGHQIRLEISSSNFPRFDRNLNTGNHPTQDAKTRQARQTVEHSRAHPSHVVLPVIPGE